MSEHNVKFLDGKDKTKELLGRTRTSLVFRPDGQNAEVAIHNLEVEKADKAYVDEALSTLQLAEVVDELPETGEKNKLYLVPRTDGEDQNLFDEYLWIDFAWEKIGTVSTQIDLSTYPEYSNFKTGFTYSALPGQKTNISVTKATPNDISDQTATEAFITPSNQEYAVFYGLAKAAGARRASMIDPMVGTYTDDAKAKIQDMLGVTEKINEIQLFKFPNATIIGEPTINNGQVSGFGQNAYLKFPFLVDFNSRPFEINMEFTTGANIQSQENIFDSDFGLAFAIRSGKFVIAISTNGTSWNLGEGVGTHNVQPNTTYRVKFAWDRMTYRLSYSTNGGASYTEDIAKVGAFQPAPKQIYIGAGENFGSVFNWFTGIINMNHCTLSILGQVIWQGMDDAGLATRLETDLSNIDADGIKKIKELAGGGSFTDNDDGSVKVELGDDVRNLVQIANSEKVVVNPTSFVENHQVLSNDNATIFEDNLFPFGTDSYKDFYMSLEFTNIMRINTADVSNNNSVIFSTGMRSYEEYWNGAFGLARIPNSTAFALILSGASSNPYQFDDGGYDFLPETNTGLDTNNYKVIITKKVSSDHNTYDLTATSFINGVIYRNITVNNLTVRSMPYNLYIGGAMTLAYRYKRSPIEMLIKKFAFKYLTGSDDTYTSVTLGNPDNIEYPTTLSNAVIMSDGSKLSDKKIYTEEEINNLIDEKINALDARGVSY